MRLVLGSCEPGPSLIPNGALIPQVCQATVPRGWLRPLLRQVPPLCTSQVVPEMIAAARAPT